ncbi:MAG: type VI secretion system baseplate subunit TssG [Chitinispirillaceae bacterium]
MSDLIELLKTRSREFDFFQAVTLLEEYFASEKSSGDAQNDARVKFSANPDIGFPSSDIASVKEHEGWGIELLLSFMGLLGISSPLPHYFTDYGAKQLDESSPLTDFVNIFDHRIYSLFYQAHMKYRSVPSWTNHEDSKLHKSISAFTGLDTNDRITEELLMCAGLFAGVSRNGDSLAEILSECLGVRTQIRQWVPRWAEVKNRCRLGFNLVVGDDALLGERVFDRTGKICVVVDLEKTDDFERFLIDSRQITKVNSIVRLFSAQPLDFDIHVRFKASMLIPIQLGSDNAKMGISGSCGINSDEDEYHSIIIAASG